MRLTAAQDNPARSSGSLGWGTWGGRGGSGPGLPRHSRLHLQSWCQVSPKRSPCNKPLHLPSSKDSCPNLPASLPTTELPEFPSLSLPPVCPQVCLLFLPALGARSPSPHPRPRVQLGEILSPRMGIGGSILGCLVSCTEMVCCVRTEGSKHEAIS